MCSSMHLGWPSKSKRLWWILIALTATSGGLITAIWRQGTVGIKIPSGPEYAEPLANVKEVWLDIPNANANPGLAEDHDIALSAIDFRMMRFRIDPDIPHRLLVNPTKVCSSYVPQSLVTFGVASPVRDRQRRLFLRKVLNKMVGSWGSVVFVVAIPEENLEEDAPWDEIERFGDLMVFDNHDTYFGLSNKTQAMITWYAHSCRGFSKYLLKLDGDVALNWGPLLSILGSQTLPPYVYMGHVLHRSPVIKSLKHRNHEEAPELLRLKTFPRYNNGPSYLLNHPTAEVFVDTLKQHFVDWGFRNEDAMVGLILRKSHIVPQNALQFIPTWKSRKLFRTCHYDEDHDLTRHILDCPCEAWVTLHCGSRRKQVCYDAWRRSLECNLGPESAKKVLASLQIEHYG
eukprot:Gregarina_sp_Poly_1__1186@NODE_128_length_13277_cov_115_450643_g114_i0_p5_GENE_NODE_128_length_13277_cov_115_450643_g114_i0NODE_128_length_13277_cov_115_450643_g114_i0_p5_ORF_typecomplete_len401_score39_11Galactosyl_T/PF01762_21/5_6e26Fringe/PF02434_16/6_5e06_NODE_128_length_13277_cov_115_450643_g114_i038685070